MFFLSLSLFKVIFTRTRETLSFFSTFFSVAGKGGKVWEGPRQTVNWLGFQWSSQSADICLPWEGDGRSCQLGPGASLFFIKNLCRRWWVGRCQGVQAALFPHVHFPTSYFSNSYLLLDYFPLLMLLMTLSCLMYPLLFGALFLF